MLTAADIFGDKCSNAKHQQAEIPLRSEMLYGLAGEVVRTIYPHTEADAGALLGNLLVGFGSLIGRKAYYEVEGVKHNCNLFPAQVGPTAAGRKGTATNRILRILERADPEWAQNKVQSGLSSGEGLIETVAHPKGESTDRRLLVVQSEFASALTVMARQGNTLSGTLRDAWDSGKLQTMVRNNPLWVDDAHISIVTHISRDEIQRNLDRTEVANGFANRFLWIRSLRSKCLPEGGNLASSELDRLAELLKPAVAFGRRELRLRRDADARDAWARVYPRLSEGRPGLIGAIASRAEAQALRLSCIYSLMDCSEIIRIPHLEAALALWDYTAECIDWIFGDILGDPLAEAILEALRASSEGLSRSEISGILGHNKSAAQIKTALRTLTSSGLACSSSQPTGGRSAEMWRAAPMPTK
jgi:hypothetical protein